MEATTTLADSLLDDLDDLMESDDDGDNNDNHNSNGDAPATDESDRCRNDDNVDGEDSKLSSKPSGASSDQKKNGFLDNSSLQRHLKTIRDHAESSAEARSKENEEQNHQLVVQSNKWLASLAEEIGEAHKNLADAYRPKFSELETLLPNIVQYKNAVKIIGNEMDLTKVNDGLDAILTNSQIMTLAVAGSTTSGRPLADDELRNVEALIVYIERLFEVQDELQRFVERSMEALVPSVSTLIGSSIAARLLGLAGGLQELTKIPSCNLSVIGQTKVNADSRAGLSGVSVKQHSGILAESDIVRSVPKSLQKKALKVVAAKLALAIRFDFVNVNTGRPRSAETGLKLKAEVNEKFEKWQEPDKAPTSKALPKPDLEVKKRRGGKRMRRWKERFEETALMKQANTRAFSAQQGEYGDDAMGITMGLLDTADNGGAIRKVTEKRNIRQANTKASRKRAAQMAQHTKNKDGLASSVVFTQTTGMELINPEANKERVRQANEKWFSEHGGFQSVKPKK